MSECVGRVSGSAEIGTRFSAGVVVAAAAVLVDMVRRAVRVWVARMRVVRL